MKRRASGVAAKRTTPLTPTSRRDTAWRRESSLCCTCSRSDIRPRRIWFRRQRRRLVHCHQPSASCEHGNRCQQGLAGRADHHGLTFPKPKSGVCTSAIHKHPTLLESGFGLPHLAQQRANVARVSGADNPTHVTTSRVHRRSIAPVLPSIRRRSPSASTARAPLAPTIAGTPIARATMAPWERVPPHSAITPATAGRIGAQPNVQ